MSQLLVCTASKSIAEDTRSDKSGAIRVFSPYLDSPSESGVDLYTRWLSWTGADLRELVIPLNDIEGWEPPTLNKRSIQAVLEHILAEYTYIYAYGRIDGLPTSGSIISRSTGPLLDWIMPVRNREIEHLKSWTEVEQYEPFIDWNYPGTGSKELRRMLEHHWKYPLEMNTRLR